ncbi:MAG TPA: MDR family MFS transporter [Pseudolabrys sp.]|nr:MDR family MFS transporter [Pseudolabrys sp.]
MTSSRSAPRRSRPSGRGKAAHRRPPRPPAPPAAAAAVHEEHPFTPLPHNEVLPIILGIMLAMFLGALDQTIVATALPTIGQHFRDLGDLSWVVTAYLLTGTAVTPLYGKLSDMHGRRVTLLTAIGLFMLGSIACALAPSMTALIMGRGLQGLGGGGLMALSQTIIADVVTPRERGRYQGYIAAVFATSSVGGPVLGGFLTEHIDWSVIFWINVPLALAALGMTSNVLKRVPYHPRKHQLDVLGAVLMMLAAVAMLLALSWGGRKFDWLSLPIVGLLVGSGVLWAAFGWRLLTAGEPFLPLTVLGNPVVRCAALAGACSMATLVGMTIFVPLYFEVVLHLSASQSGLALIPLMGSTVTLSTVTGRAMMHVVHYKRMPFVGVTIAIAGLGVLAIWPASLHTAAVLAVLAIIGAGLGSLFPVSTVCMQNAVVQSQMGIATATANFFRALLSALVVAVLGAIVLSGLGGATGTAVETLARASSLHTLAHAFRYVFLSCALVLCFGMAFLLAMEERVLRGPSSHSPQAGAPTAPATPIPE